MYRVADPTTQIAIEALNAGKGGKVPIVSGGFAAKWVELIPKALRAEAVAERNASVAPEKSAEQAYVLSTRDSYRAVAGAAEQFVDRELGMRGALHSHERVSA